MSSKIVRTTCAVPPDGLTATMFRTLVPPVIGTCTLQLPSTATGVDADVVAEFPSVFVAVTYTVLPEADVPETVTGEPVDGGVVGGRGHRQRRRALRLGDVPVERRRRSIAERPRADVTGKPHLRACRPGQRRRRTGRPVVLEAEPRRPGRRPARR